MKPNRVKKTLEAGETVIGTMISEVRNAEIAYILAASGMDFLMLDMEHSSVDLESSQEIVRAALSAGIVPLARVVENQYPFIARILDTGVMGIMVPRVHTPDQARQVVRAAKYPPQGDRGFGVRGMITDYAPVSMREIIDWANDHTLLIIQVESNEALTNLDEITSVQGIDVALIGPSDLSISLGIPGEFENPRFLEAAEHTFRVCLRNGVSPSIFSVDLKMAKQYQNLGMKFILYTTESGMLRTAATQAVEQLRSTLPKTKEG